MVALIFWANPVKATDVPQPPEFPLKVEVRTIKAEGLLKENTEASGEVTVDHEIQDLTPQLERLHYSEFHLVDQQSVVLPPRKRRKLELADGHRIVIRPVAVDGDNICLWLNWKDREGMQLLDTRLRFVAGESMLTGTDHTPEKGLILAIRVQPVR
jgi:hypothetical protein